MLTAFYAAVCVDYRQEIDRHAALPRNFPLCGGVLKGGVAAQVKAVNGKPIRNLGELVAEVDGTAADYLRLDLEYNQVGLSPVAPLAFLMGLPVC